MRRGEHKDVHPSFGAFGLLRFNFPVCAKKDEQVQRDQREGDDRPAAALHVFMAQRNQHRATPSPRSGGGVGHTRGYSNKTKTSRGGRWVSTGSGPGDGSVVGP